MQYIVLQFDGINYRYKVYIDEIKRYMTNVLHSLGERERKKVSDLLQHSFGRGHSPTNPSPIQPISALTRK